MKKRSLSLFLALVMIVSLFSGLSLNASAEGIADLFGTYFTGESIKKLFGDKVAHGYCGVDSQGNDTATVQYDIYEVSDPTVVQENPLLQYLFESIGYDYTDTVQYYGIYIYPADPNKPSAMKDYTNSVDVIGTGEKAQESPWSSHHYLLKDGTEADLKEHLVVAYIDDGVTNVGARAFDSIRYLTACYLSDSIKTIGKRAFEKVEYLGAINMPRSLEEVKEAAFYGCNTLTFLRAGSCSKLKKIGDHAFFSCTMLATVEFPMGLEEIGPYAFAWDRILGETTLTLPTSLRKIGEYAFAFCTHFKRLNVPKSVTNIGPYAFIGAYDMSKLTFTEGGTEPLTIGAGAFAAAYSLAEVQFDDRVRSIGTAAFGGCERLESVTFGTGMNTIGARGFTSMTSSALVGLEAVIEAFKKSGDFNGDGDYVAELSKVLESLTRITPLKKAAFNGDPCYVQAATDVERSFPEDCVVYYRPENYNWKAELTADGKWKGYNTDHWAGHFHEYTETVVAPNCTDQGYTRHTCTVAGCSYNYDDQFVDALGHQSKLVRTVEPTCTSVGANFYECGRPGCPQPKYVETVPANGHDTSRCIRVEPTCTRDGSLKGICPVCNETIDEILPAKGHDISWLTTVTEPTCTEQGKYEGWCPDCGQQVMQTVPALGHDYSQCKRTEPTCTTAGSYDGTCIRCAKIVHDIIPATGHNYVETGRVEPTCTTEGYTEYTCNHCGEVLRRDVTACIPHTEQATVIAPTCILPGYTKVECAVCGKLIRMVEDSATGHDPQPIVVAPTCTEKGYTKYICGNCNEEVGLRTDETPVANHSWGPTQIVIAPTATATGLARRTCTACGTIEERTIPATGGGSSGGDDTACTGGPACPGYAFRDMPSPGYWSHEAIDYCLKNGILYGMSDTSFGPAAATTRGQLVTMLYRMQGSPAEYSKYRSPFSDTPRNQYYFDAVMWAYYNGIVSGMGNGTFSPNAPITREQMAVIMMNYTGKCVGATTGSTSLNSFPDAVSVSSWARDAMSWAVANGIISGVASGSSTYLRPQGTAIREQVASILMRYELNIAK